MSFKQHKKNDLPANILDILAKSQQFEVLYDHKKGKKLTRFIKRNGFVNLYEANFTYNQTFLDRLNRMLHEEGVKRVEDFIKNRLHINDEILDELQYIPIDSLNLKSITDVVTFAKLHAQFIFPKNEVELLQVIKHFALKGYVIESSYGSQYFCQVSKVDLCENGSRFLGLDTYYVITPGCEEEVCSDFTKILDKPEMSIEQKVMAQISRFSSSRHYLIDEYLLRKFYANKESKRMTDNILRNIRIYDANKKMVTEIEKLRVEWTSDILELLEDVDPCYESLLYIEDGLLASEDTEGFLSAVKLFVYLGYELGIGDINGEYCIELDKVEKGSRKVTQHFKILVPNK